MDSQDYQQPQRKPGFFQDSTNLLLIAIFGIIILLSLSVSFLLLHSKKSPVSSSSSVANVTLDPRVKTYTSKLGYSFTYPQNLTPVESGNQKVDFTYNTREGQGVYVSVTLINKPFGTSPRGDVTTNKIRYIMDWRQINVDNRGAHRYVQNPCPTSCPTQIADVPFNKGTQILQFSSKTADPKPLDDILSHFKYTK